ncbi:hypothetical protein SESBI_41541 [Sesbania bispinosa]|nr:hypothetical protein SESBI_41541 [Sesbania bispinosa]
MVPNPVVEQQGGGAQPKPREEEPLVTGVNNREGALKEDDIFGSWMIIQRKPRRQSNPRNEGENQGKVNANASGAVISHETRFEILSKENHEEDMVIPDRPFNKGPAPMQKSSHVNRVNDKNTPSSGAANLNATSSNVSHQLEIQEHAKSHQGAEGVKADLHRSKSRARQGGLGSPLVPHDQRASTSNVGPRAAFVPPSLHLHANANTSDVKGVEVKDYKVDSGRPPDSHLAGASREEDDVMFDCEVAALTVSGDNVNLQC